MLTGTSCHVRKHHIVVRLQHQVPNIHDSPECTTQQDCTSNRHLLDDCARLKHFVDAGSWTGAKSTRLNNATGTGTRQRPLIDSKYVILDAHAMRAREMMWRVFLTLYDLLRSYCYHAIGIARIDWCSRAIERMRVSGRIERRGYRSMRLLQDRVRALRRKGA